MTFSEFRAWLEGFEAAMDGPPNADQWAKIKAKLATVTEPTAVKYPLVRDHGPRWDTTYMPPKMLKGGRTPGAVVIDHPRNCVARPHG